MGPCIYSIMRDSIGRGEKTRMAAVGLLYAGDIVHNKKKFRSETLDPKGSSKGGSKHEGISPQQQQKKVIRPVHGQSRTTVLCTGYCTIYYIYDLVAIGHLKLKKARKRSAGRREKERRQARNAP